LGWGAQPGDRGRRCPQPGAMLDKGHPAGQRRKKQGLFGRGVAAADDGDPAPGELATVAFGAGVDAAAPKLALAGHIEGPGFGAHREDQGAGMAQVVVDRLGLDAPSRSKPSTSPAWNSAPKRWACARIARARLGPHTASAKPG
jgi:hypothetical protein